MFVMGLKRHQYSRRCNVIFNNIKSQLLEPFGFTFKVSIFLQLHQKHLVGLL